MDIHPENSTERMNNIVQILARKKRFILVNVLVITLLAVIVSLLLPKLYRSSATILPPKNVNLFSAIGLSTSSLMRQFSPLRSLSGGLSPDLYSYVAILKSRALLSRVVEEFDLKTRYRSELMMDAIEELRSNMDYAVNEEGTITVRVSDHDAKMAHHLTVFFIHVLDSLNRDLALKEASSNRRFIEARVNQNIAEMKQTEEALKAFQESSGFIAPTPEMSTSASSFSEIYVQKSLKELEVNYLRRVLGNENPQLEAAEIQLSELTKQLSSIPDLGIQFYRLYRDFTIQQKLFETLLPLLEQAKIEENKNTPTLLVLDTPTIAERPYAPQKKIIVLVAFLFSLFSTISIAVFTERLNRYLAQQPETGAALRHLFSLRRKNSSS